MISPNQMFEELGVCAIEQGYSFIMEGIIYLDLLIVIRLEEIIKEEFE